MDPKPPLPPLTGPLTLYSISLKNSTTWTEPHRTSQLKTLQTLKSRGNTSFKNSQHAAAITDYTRCLSYFDSITIKAGVGVDLPRMRGEGGSLGSEVGGREVGRRGAGGGEGVGEEGEEVQILVSVLSNRSAAFNMVGKGVEAYRDALEVIRLRPEWVKGHFRKAEALLSL
ncbi:hypothetical protein HDU67_006044, partial [Dinochytrium kinnereticum]